MPRKPSCYARNVISLTILIFYGTFLEDVRGFSPCTLPCNASTGKDSEYVFRSGSPSFVTGNYGYDHAASILPDQTVGTVFNKHMPYIANIESHIDFEEFLYEDDRLCVVLFHATWCKNCQKFGMRYKKLAYEDADFVDTMSGSVVKPGRLRLAEVEVSSNKDLCERLGIQRLPFIQMYRDEDLLYQFACGPSKFKELTGKIRRHLH